VRTARDYFLLYLKGVGMGGADVIPGVSGGTVAFISGIYDELIDSIKSIDATALKLLLSFKIKECWAAVNGNFLIAVLAGIATSILSLAKLMTFLLEHHPIPVWSFFFGLILVSSPLILRDIKSWSVTTALFGLLGVGLAFVITILTPTTTPDNLFFIFFCGAVAICAMILPGISGAFILLLIGKYEYMISALTSFNFPVIIVFVLGCLIGLISFSHFLSWLLHHYRYPALALLAGFMVGSLNKVWPWKEVLAYRINSAGQQVPAFDQSIGPWNYLEKTGNNPLIFQAILFAALGIFLVVALEKIALSLKSKK
jgi:putative membrane protein